MIYQKKQYTTLSAKSQAEVVDVINIPLLVDAIKNGVALPKGHGRLIDGDILKEKIFRPWGSFDTVQHLISEEGLNKAPTILEADKGDKKWN